MRVRRDSRDPASGGVGQLVGQPGHDLELLVQAVDRAGPERLVGARVDLGKPAVELVLEVDVVGKPAAGLEVGLGVALQPLDGALGLRIGRLRRTPNRF
jgi:hypothetical protein